MGLGTCPRVRMAILPQVRDPSISTSVQKSVIPLKILPALNYLHLQLLITASEWLGLMDLRQCTANLNLNPCKLFASSFFSRKRSHGTTTCHAKPHLFVVSLFACSFWICCLKTLLRKCRGKKPEINNFNLHHYYLNSKNSFHSLETIVSILQLLLKLSTDINFP